MEVTEAQDQSMKLEDLRANAAVRGVLADSLVTVVSVQWFGSEALELTYKTPVGKVANELLYRDDETRLEIVEIGRPWSFDGDGALFRLVSEAQRIRLAHLFDPVLAVHTSVVEPLPHQITAVYESMLPRQPLRFLLADDPGAGKTIMAGLLIKELIARGDLQRCLVVCPGSLAEQWQDELYRRFHLPFDILTNDKLEAARTGNWFLETNLAIARLDKLSRNEDVQHKLQAPDCRFDLVVCDEAHKMSATFFGGEVRYTKRYRLGQLLSGLTRHFLLMSATPHNGKEEDFQLFMALIDGDRFEGRFRDGVHVADVSDLMRRMVKESLLKFDGTPLFPERIAYTVPYRLSDAPSDLFDRIASLLGREGSVVSIHGGVGREDRLKAQEAFRHDPQVQVLLATDAAGEGINLQRAHLMVNYDLPWNPNRLEQRFGRIHRIGQTEVCHLWNLVADETREGDVYRKLLEKLEQARKSLGGQVFDVLGKLHFEGRPLRELMVEAIRYGEQPEVRARLDTAVDHALDRGRLQELLEERALAHDAMDASRVQRIREDMVRAEARRLQPHYVESFFREAFRRLGGAAKQREARRYEITHVPAPVRNRDRLIGIGEPVLPRYERIAFEKSLVAPQGRPLAAFVCPGHPLLDAVIDLTLERHRDLLKRGAVLVDERDGGDRPRVLFYLEHAIQDASLTRSGDRRVVSRRVLYVELDADGVTRHVHYAPYLDYRPLGDDDPDVASMLDRPECAWIDRELEKKAAGYAVANVVPEHLKEVRTSRLALIAKTEAAVKDRLTKEINYWDHRAEELKLQEQAGKTGARLNSGEARKRADMLQARLRKRLEELKLEAQISPLPPVVLGGLLVAPKGLVDKMNGRESTDTKVIVDTQESAVRARCIIMETERDLGFDPTDRELEKLGYDIESRVPDTGKLRFIEVKGRVSGASTVTVTRNEILYSLNKPEDFILAIVEFLDDGGHRGHRVHYLREPFKREPDFGVTSVNYDFAELLARAEAPS